MIGQTINHRIYGKGTIVEVSSKNIVVRFSSGTKQLLYSDVFPLASSSEEKNVQPKISNRTEESVQKKSIELQETQIEAARRRFRERIEEEKLEAESYNVARQALKNQFEIREEKNREANKRRTVRRTELKQQEIENVKIREANAAIETKIRGEQLSRINDKLVRDLRIRTRISRERELKEFLEKRGIKYLLHFTRIDNLISILQNGFVPANLQESMGISSIHNDQSRYDSQRDCTSFSIGFPNYRLLYSFQNKYPEAKWVILFIDAEIILSNKHVVYFCQTNAAREMNRTIRKTNLCELSALEGMFCSSAKTSDKRTILRKDLNLVNIYTTDPQAEVLISDLITPNIIRYICFPDSLTRDDSFIVYNSNLLKKYSVIYSDEYFSYRKDFPFWKADQNHG